MKMMVGSKGAAGAVDAPCAAGFPAADRQRDTADKLAALRRIALAVVRPSAPSEKALLHELLAELTQALPADGALVAVFGNDSRSTLQTLAVRLDGQALPDFEYPVRGSPCERVVGAQFRYIARGVLAEVDPQSHFAQAGLDAYAAFPLNDGRGAPTGVLAALGRAPIAGGDAGHAEVVLKVVAGRLAGELERRQALNVLRDTALAVSAASGETVFDELARMLASSLQVEFAFIARHEPSDPEHLTMVALHSDGRTMRGQRYALAPTPCSTVLGRQFQAYPRELAALFPDDPDVLGKGAESYAGLPLAGIGGQPLGVIAVGSRRPLEHVGHIEAVLKIFAVRAAAEIERLRALEALRRSEASYRTIFDSAESAIFVHDWDHFALIDVNRRACEEHGRAREELLGVPPGELLGGEPPYDLEHAIEKLQLARLGRCPPFEWRMLHRDGSVRWCEIHLKPVQLDGRPCILAFTHDITARKLVEQQLRASEEQYRAIFNASADALILWDSRFRRVDVNRAYERIYGWSRDEVIGGGYEHLPFGEDYARPRVELVRRALAGEACSAELEARRRNGERIATEVHAIPFQHRGEPHVLAIARDITERKLAEAQLRAREEQYRAIFDGSVDPMVLWNSRLEVADVNQAFVHVTGFPREAVVGRRWSERPDAADLRKLLPHIEAALAGKVAHRIERVSHADGSLFDMELRYLPVRIGGEPHALGIGRDITERLQLEAQLRQAQKMEAIGQLTGGIAHDFNNILTTVLGYVAMAEERARGRGDDDKLLRQLGQARAASERARDLVAQMLAFARRQGGSRQPLSLAKLVRESMELLRSTLPSSVLLQAEALTAALPDVEADAVQLGQVLMNLVINARDAVGGMGQVRVALRERPLAGADGESGWRCRSCGHLAPRGRWVELSVADDGSGIEPETLRRMFDPFFTTKAPGRGTGMGLAMVHGIVHQHGGHIGVDTRVGEGSTFRVLLPALGVPAPSGATPGDAAAPMAAAGALAPDLAGRVLVVEDDVPAGDFLRDRLEAWGLEVVLQRDARAALAWLDDATQRIDLLVTDLTMPHLSGLQLARLATERRRRLPVLLVSGDLAAAGEQARAAAGIGFTLAKPLDPAALRQVLEQALAARTEAA